jgi:hypothetical protein
MMHTRSPLLHEQVIAPNMGKQIVAFQTMMTMMSERFPGCFAGYTLQARSIAFFMGVCTCVLELIYLSFWGWGCIIFFFCLLGFFICYFVGSADACSIPSAFL